MSEKKKEKNIIITGKCGGNKITMSVSREFLKDLSKEMREEAIVKRRGGEVPCGEHRLINILKRGGTIRRER